MRISDWSSDVCSSDLCCEHRPAEPDDVTEDRDGADFRRLAISGQLPDGVGDEIDAEPEERQGRAQKGNRDPAVVAEGKEVVRGPPGDGAADGAKNGRRGAEDPPEPRCLRAEKGSGG